MKSLAAAWRNAQLEPIRRAAVTAKATWERLLSEAETRSVKLNLPETVQEPFGGYLGTLARRLEEGLRLRVAAAEAEGAYQGAVQHLAGLKEDGRKVLTMYQRPASGSVQVSLEALVVELDTARQHQTEFGKCQVDLNALQEEREAKTLSAFLEERGVEESRFPAAWAEREHWKPLFASYADQKRVVETRLQEEDLWSAENRVLLDRGQSPLGRRELDLANLRAAVLEKARQANELVQRATESDREAERKAGTLKQLSNAGTQTGLIAARDVAAQALEAQRQREIDQRASAILIRRLEQRSRLEHLPPQLRIARDLFSRFTHHRYLLEFIDAAFYASEGGRLIPLEALSEGTRIQLLMAVRLGYIEFFETAAGLQLPIFLDEVLGNSDDARALAIIETILQLADTGRQIFYFTAQSDEVAKWRSLGGDRVEFKDLEVIRRRTDVARHPLPEKLHQRTPVEPPGGRSLEAYVRALNLPGPSAWVPIGLQHPWLALLEGDQVFLHRMLGIELVTLSQVKHYLAAREAGPESARVLGTIALLEAAQQALQDVLPKPLDANGLQGFEARWRDATLEAARSCGWDARLLMETDIDRMGEQGRVKLKEFLVKGGFTREVETPRMSVLNALKEQHGRDLPQDSAGWEAVERFVFQTPGPPVRVE